MGLRCCRWAGLLLGVLAPLGSAQAQQAAPATRPQASDVPVTTLRIGTRLVSVQAVVLDAKGEPVRGLTRDDFTLKQDGKPQELRFFSEDSELPLTLALMVDTSSSQRMFLEDETEASEKFFKAMLTRPEDRAVLLQFDYDVLELQKMTGEVRALENALRFLSMPHAPTPNSHGGTLLYDGIVVAAQAALSKERGRRAMVILTDGEDNGSRYTLEQAVAAAQRADIVVYAVLYSLAESGFAGGGGGGAGRIGPVLGRVAGREVLETLANATGGRVFTVNRATPLGAIYTQIAEDMRLQYQMAYAPPESAPGAYHGIELKAKAKHLTVRARQGYYSAGPQSH